jgi:hypothetical protein
VVVAVPVVEVVVETTVITLEFTMEIAALPSGMGVLVKFSARVSQGIVVCPVLTSEIVMDTSVLPVIVMSGRRGAKKQQSR